MDVVSQEREPLNDGVVQPTGPATGEVVFDDVAFAYAEDKPVLSGINLDARAGQAIALLGATGSGKTSLVNLLPRFYDYTSGRLTLDGVESEGVSARVPAPADRHRRAGAVPVLAQHPGEHRLRRAPEGVTDEQVEAAARGRGVTTRS